MEDYLPMNMVYKYDGSLQLELTKRLSKQNLVDQKRSLLNYFLFNYGIMLLILIVKCFFLCHTCVTVILLCFIHATKI